jgi:hypothetical protein
MPDIGALRRFPPADAERVFGVVVGSTADERFDNTLNASSPTPAPGPP